jgi:hypothetical protein
MYLIKNLNQIHLLFLTNFYLYFKTDGVLVDEIEIGVKR